MYKCRKEKKNSQIYVFTCYILKVELMSLFWEMSFRCIFFSFFVNLPLKLGLTRNIVYFAKLTSDPRNLRL